MAKNKLKNIIEEVIKEYSMIKFGTYEALKLKDNIINNAVNKIKKLNEKTKIL